MLFNNVPIRPTARPPDTDTVAYDSSNLISVDLAAAACGPGVTPELLYELIDTGHLPGYHIDNDIQVRLHDVNAVLSHHTATETNRSE